MPRKTNTQILKSNLILCEGRDEQEFLIQYLNSTALSNTPEFSNDIQVIDFGGNSELTKKLAILKNMDNFDKLTSLLIIRDAETSAESACREIQRALRENGFSVPKGPHCWEGELLKVGFVLFPTCGSILQNGTLEDLCLSILSDQSADESLEEIDLFLARLKNAVNGLFPEYLRLNYIHTSLFTMIMYRSKLVKRQQQVHSIGII